MGVPWLYSACSHCEYCLTGWETVCAQTQFGGYSKNGSFAEYVVADPNCVACLPAGLEAADAAPLICADTTIYRGIKETETKPGDPAATVKKETGSGTHGVLMTAPALAAFKQGIGMTR